MIRSESSQNLDVVHQKNPSSASTSPPEQANLATWLVSVRDVSELQQAVLFDVNIIDLKEPSDKPSNGPLAPVAPSIWRSAVDSISKLSRKVLLSAALGEWQQAVVIAKEVPRQFTFAKVGPSECRSTDDLVKMWRQTQSQLGAVELVAVAYADAIQCPDAMSVLTTAAEFGLKRILIDTYEKDGGNSVDILGLDQLAQLAATARSLGIWWTLAGSVTSDHINLMQQNGISPNCYGVRGDICDSARTGCLSKQRMQVWSDTLKNSRSFR